MYGPLSRTEHTTSLFINIYSSEHFIGEQPRILNGQEFTASSENSATLSREDNCTRFVDDHFEVHLPWNSSTQILPNNYVVAIKAPGFLTKTYVT